MLLLSFFVFWYIFFHSVILFCGYYGTKNSNKLKIFNYSSL